MVVRDLISAKLAELAHRTGRARVHARPSASELQADEDALELVSFNLMLAVQVCADIAAHIVSDSGWVPPKNLAQGFERLAEHGVIHLEVARQLQKAVGLRNVVAHGYAGLDVGSVHRASTDGLQDLEAFAAQVAAWVSEQPITD